MLTKGAIGNLLNRYRAVLKKCCLINVFGSMAVASLLVMGGGVCPAEAQDISSSEELTSNQTYSDGLWVHKDVTLDAQQHTITVNGTIKDNDDNIFGIINDGTMKNNSVMNASSILNFGTMDAKSLITSEEWAFFNWGKDATTTISESVLSSRVHDSIIENEQGAMLILDAGDSGKKIVIQPELNNENGSVLYINSDTILEYSLWNTAGSKVYVADEVTLEVQKGIQNGLIGYGFSTESARATVFDAPKANIIITDQYMEFRNEGVATVNSLDVAYDIVNNHRMEVNGEISTKLVTNSSTGIFTYNNVAPVGANLTNTGIFYATTGSLAIDGNLSSTSSNAQLRKNESELLENLAVSGNLLIGNQNGADAGRVTLEVSDSISASSITLNNGIIRTANLNAETNLTNYSQNKAPNSDSNVIEVNNLKLGGNLSNGTSIRGSSSLGYSELIIHESLMYCGDDTGAITNEGVIAFDGKNAVFSGNMKLAGTGELINNGNLLIENVFLADFGGTYSQTSGSTTLAGDSNFFGGDVTIEKGSLTVGNMDTSAASGADSMLALGRSITVADGQNLRIGTASGTGVVFGSGSALIVDGNVASTRAMIKGSDMLTVDKDSQLYITNAKTNTNYTITEGLSGDSYWDEANLLANRLINATVFKDGDAVMVETEVQDVASALPGIIPAAGLTTMLAQNLNDTESGFMGVRFLSRATEPLYMSDDGKAVATINEVSRASVTAGVQNTSLRLADAASDTVLHHLSLGNFDSGNSIHQDGWDIWVTPMYGNTYTHGMSASAASVRGNYGGLAIGADTQVGTLAGGNVRMGAAINGGGGKSETSGTATDTENSYNFGGVNLYAGWNLDNLNVMASLGYSMGSHDVKMNLPASLGMGQAKADVDSHAFTADLRAEYQFKTDWLDILPHAGVRYTALHTDGYDLKVNGSTLNSVESDTQHIVQFPVGVTVTKNIDVAGWNIKPQADVSVIPAAGEKKAFTKVSFSGIDAADSVNTRIMDSTSWAGMLGVQAEKGNLALGLNYGVQASRHETDQRVNVGISWKF